MAKIVTLKNPSDEDIYPVTDASGIRVTGNVTLQQALDGFVYADDPTAPATPTAWITGSDIDWSTVTPRVIAAGTHNFGTVSSGTVKNYTVTIPTQPDANYAVSMSNSSDGAYWTWIRCAALAKTTSSFNIQCTMDTAGASLGDVKIDYIVVKY